MQKLVCSALLTTALVAVSHAQFQAINLGASIGAYYPLSSEIRDVFGSRILKVGIQPVQSQTLGGGVSGSIDLITANSNGSSFYIIPVTVSYEKSLSSGPKIPLAAPYIKFSAGIAYFNFDLTLNSGQKFSSTRTGTTAGVELGYKFLSNAKIFAKYNYFVRQEGLDFSGIQVGAVVSLFKL